jgi:flagellar biosynthesis protein FliR
MQSVLETFLANGVFAFLLTFMRVGTAVMIMPGLGDSFISERIRLHMALGLSFVLLPLVMTYMPPVVPPFPLLVALIVQELMIGLMIGTVARIFMTALDTAGMVISAQSGLANAQIFNPAMSTQGSLVGAMLSVTGMLVLFATNMHHVLIIGIVESYKTFPLGKMPDVGSMAELISYSVSASFTIGIKLATPFIVMTMLIYVGMGVLSRLMPQVQVFMLALPLQILLSIIMLMIVFSAIFTYWLARYQDAISYLFSIGG